MNADKKRKTIDLFYPRSSVFICGQDLYPAAPPLRLISMLNRLIF